MHYYKKISIGTTTMRSLFLIVHSFWQSFQKRNSHNFKKLCFVPYFENLTKIYESKEKNRSQSGVLGASGSICSVLNYPDGQKGLNAGGASGLLGGVMDVVAGCALLIIGILGATHAMPLSTAITWALVGSGATYLAALCLFPSWVVIGGYSVREVKQAFRPDSSK